jgi:hypothetical protein
MSVEQARNAIDAFFKAFNARDMEALKDSLNYPHVRIAIGRVAIAKDRSEFRGGFDGLAEREGWDRSTLDKADVVHASDNKVHFAIEFSRYKKDGTKYVTHKSLWIVTRLGDHWGVQARSSFAL